MPAPDFIIPGEMKTGTTTLVKNLIKHPDIYIPYTMQGSHEMHFFSRYYNRGGAWYESMFRTGAVNGDKSMSYLQNKIAMQRLAKNYPDTKIVYSVRNPVNRLLSQVNMRVINGWKLSYNRVMSDQEFFGRGLYGKRYKYLCTIFPKENIYISVCEESNLSSLKKELSENESGTIVRKNDSAIRTRINGVLQFLGLHPIESNYEYHFVAPKKCKIDFMYNNIEKVKKYYRQDTEHFFEQIGYEIKGWL